MKKLLVAVLTILCFVPFTVFGAENKKVKVYIFEAGGCPYCEMQVEYLQKLDSYNKKFEIVRKEAFIDHVDWKPGKDYQLGMDVAQAFTNAKYNSQLSGTPFVVISDIYAYATYSESLESIINQAYEEGDKDAVSCVAAGKDNCVRENPNPEEITDDTGTTTGTTTTTSSSDNDASGLMVIVLLIFLVTYVVKSELDKKRLLSAIYSKKAK